MVRGIGIGLRPRHLDQLSDGFDFLEVTPENWLFDHGPRRKKFDAVCERFAVLSHSVSLSVAGVDPLDSVFLDVLKPFLHKTRAPWFSDHLCNSTLQGRPTHELLPVPFSTAVVKRTAARIRELQDRMETPFVVENATFYAQEPGAEMDEAAFINAVVRESGCGLLLDVNNVYVNAVNQGFDPRVFIDSMPLDRVVELHLAGHTREEDIVIDTHIGPICEEVWALYRYTRQRVAAPALIEWDAEIPALDVLLAEVARAR